VTILDQRSFPSGDPDGKELLAALLELYYLAPDVQRFVQEIGMPPAQFAWNGAMEDVWPEVLQKAAASNLLRRLVRAVAADPGSAAYSALFQRLLAIPAPAAAGIDPYLVCLLGSGGRRPFLDRTELRTHLRELARENGPRVLIITGPAQSGKSYSWYLIDHVKRVGAFSPIRVDLSSSAWSGPAAGPADVMGEVAYKLGWAPPVADPTAQEDTQARTLRNWFLGRVRTETAGYWLIFDGLDASTMTNAALRLVESLAIAAERGEAGELRVVLIAYSGSLPQDVDPYTLRDPISAIGVAELRAFLERVALDAGQVVDDEGLELLLQELLGPNPRPAELPLPAVSPRAGVLAHRLFLPGDGGGDGDG
jgi:hypothetical protein